MHITTLQRIGVCSGRAQSQVQPREGPRARAPGLTLPPLAPGLLPPAFGRVAVPAASGGSPAAAPPPRGVVAPRLFAALTAPANPDDA